MARCISFFHNTRFAARQSAFNTRASLSGHGSRLNQGREEGRQPPPHPFPPREPPASPHEAGCGTEAEVRGCCSEGYFRSPSECPKAPARGHACAHVCERPDRCFVSAQSGCVRAAETATRPSSTQRLQESLAVTQWTHISEQHVQSVHVN